MPRLVAKADVIGVTATPIQPQGSAACACTRLARPFGPPGSAMPQRRAIAPIATRMRLILLFRGCRFYRRVSSMQEAGQEAGRFSIPARRAKLRTLGKMLRIIERAVHEKRRDQTPYRLAAPFLC